MGPRPAERSEIPVVRMLGTFYCEDTDLNKLHSIILSWKFDQYLSIALLAREKGYQGVVVLRENVRKAAAVEEIEAIRVGI